MPILPPDPEDRVVLQPVGRPCCVCNHPRREEIEALILRGRAFRAISRQIPGVERDGIRRHRTNHMPQVLVDSRHLASVANVDRLAARAEELFLEARGGIERAKQAGNVDQMLRAIDSAGRRLAGLGQMQGQLQAAQQTTYNFFLGPEWATIKAIVAQALSPYPEARVALAAALSAHGSGISHGNGNDILPYSPD